MKPKFEAMRPKNPSAVALEAAALGFVAWQLRNRYFREKDEPGKKEPGEYPLVDTVDDADVYIHPGNEGSLTVGELSPDGLVEISAGRSLTDEGVEQFTLHSVSTDDESRLQVLREHLSKLLDAWHERLNINS